MMKIEKIQTSDKVRSELRIFALESDAPVLLIFPAMGVPARKYDTLAKQLNQQKLRVAIAELRGVASSSVRASRICDFGYQELVAIDFPLALAETKALFPKEDVYILGHSLGGQLAALMLAREATQDNDSSNGLILSASCSIYYQGWGFPKNLFILAFTQLSTVVARLMGYFPGKKLNFGGREAKTVIADWAQSARTGNYVFGNRDFDYERALRQVSLPVLAINFADDHFAPEKATNLLVNKLVKCQVTKRGISREQLRAKSADHFSWLRKPEIVAQNINEWVKEQPNQS